MTSTTRSQSVRVYDEERAHVTRVLAYKNGTFDRGVRLMANTFAEMLSVCTHRLDLPFAARRLFNADGHELHSNMDLALLPRDAIVYASTGDAFQDPFAATVHKDKRVRTRASVWSATGVGNCIEHYSNDTMHVVNG